MYCRCYFSDVYCIDVFVYVVLRHSCVVQGFYTPRGDCPSRINLTRDGTHELDRIDVFINL